LILLLLLLLVVLLVLERGVVLELRTRERGWRSWLEGRTE
jgi:hypothetical protein